MKTFYKLSFILLVGGYFCFSLIQLSDPGINYIDELKKRSNLSQVINFNEVDCSNQNFILGKRVVMDSTILGVSNFKGSYLVKTEVANKCGKKIFAILKCTSNDIQKINTSKNNHGFLTAYINKIESSNPIAIGDSIEGNNIFLKGEEVLILSGTFLDFSEMNFYKDAI